MAQINNPSNSESALHHEQRIPTIFDIAKAGLAIFHVIDPTMYILIALEVVITFVFACMFLLLKG